MLIIFVLYFSGVQVSVQALPANVRSSQFAQGTYENAFEKDDQTRRFHRYWIHLDTWSKLIIIFHYITSFNYYTIAESY